MIPMSRLNRLRQSIRARATRCAPPRLWPDDEERLAEFEVLGRAGEFDHEPDFHRAVATYCEAIVQAKQSTEPPFDPPEDFQPGERHDVRLDNWRSEDRFPRVRESREWLVELQFRLLMGTPPVSEAEFAGLAAWFAANDERLGWLSRPSGVLVIDNGERTCCANVRYGLRQGPRADGSGEVAEEIRQLRNRYGG